VLNRKQLGRALLFVVFLRGTLVAQVNKQTLRSELAEQERKSGYSLVDTWGGRGEVYVVSVTDRTTRKVKSRDVQEDDLRGTLSPQKRYLLFYKNGVWLRDNESGEQELIDAQGRFSSQCWSSDQRRFVYGTGKTLRIYDTKDRKILDIANEQDDYPTWSPDGKWIGFYEGNHYVLMDPSGSGRKKLFKSKYGGGAHWSPDSRYLTYTNLGGPMGGFLFWGIECVEPYRVWVWRVEDGAHDWVLNICKPGRTFLWVMNSALSGDLDEAPPKCERGRVGPFTRKSIFRPNVLGDIVAETVGERDQFPIRNLY